MTRKGAIHHTASRDLKSFAGQSIELQFFASQNSELRNLEIGNQNYNTRIQLKRFRVRPNSKVLFVSRELGYGLDNALAEDQGFFCRDSLGDFTPFLLDIFVRVSKRQCVWRSWRTLALLRVGLARSCIRKHVWLCCLIVCDAVRLSMWCPMNGRGRQQTKGLAGHTRGGSKMNCSGLVASMVKTQPFQERTDLGHAYPQPRY